MSGQTPYQEFVALIEQADDRLDLEAAAFAIARSEYPNLDLWPYRQRLDQIAEQVAARLPARSEPFTVLESLNHTLFGEMGFRGNREDYYDPRNSFLNDVLDRRTGIPITLSLVYMAVGHRLGLPLVGIGLPGHFLVQYAGESRGLFIDPFNAGLLLTRSDCERRLRELFGQQARLEEGHLQPVSKRALLFRMLGNLRGIYVNQQRWEKALAILEWLLALAPEEPSLIRERGLVNSHLGHTTRARADLEEYLRREPAASDADEVRAQLATLTQLRARLN